MNESVNCRQLHNFSLFKSIYVFIDTSREFESKAIFDKKGIPVKIVEYFIRPDSRYSVVICKVPKKYKNEFAECMEELESKLLILGYHDYEEFCNKFFNELE